MDQDFYIEDTSPWKVIITIIVVLSLIGGGLYYYFNFFAENNIRLKNVTVELGMPLSNNINDYIKGNDSKGYKLDTSNVKVDEDGNVTSTGEYSYKLIKGNDVKKGKLFVKDTTNPSATTKEITVGVNEEFEPREFVESCNDLSLPCSVKYKTNSDKYLNEKEGTYNLTIVISDSEGNEVEKDVILNVSKNSSLAGTKKKDLKAAYTSNEKINWNETYTLKLEEALDDESEEFDGVIEELSTKNVKFDKSIKNKEILVIYNKYDYAIGFSIVVTFDDDTVSFATNKDIISEETEEND